MKRFIASATLMFLCLSAVWAQATTQQAPSREGTPVISFETTEIDYGTIQQNAEPYREFRFTNVGDAPLAISNAKGSCGCTVPEWPKEPVAPGESNVIKVRYATNRIGPFSKTVTLTTNDEAGQHVLRIKGEVLQPPQEDGSNNNR